MTCVDAPGVGSRRGEAHLRVRRLCIFAPAMLAPPWRLVSKCICRHSVVRVRRNNSGMKCTCIPSHITCSSCVLARRLATAFVY